MNKNQEKALCIAIDVLSTLLSNGLQDEDVEFSVEEMIKMKNKNIELRMNRKKSRSETE